MTKLDQNVAKEIATVINRMESSWYMRASAIEKSEWEESARWTLRWAEAVVELADTYGIILPNIDMARERVGESA